VDKPFAGAVEFFEALEKLQFTANDFALPTGQRPCPICQKVMVAEQFDDIALDICRDHGVWLDSGELQTLIARARSSGNA
jgi:hypothetical protein